MLKRLFDFVLALVLLILLGIPMGIIALVILFLMGRPVMFRQVRPGLRARLFTIMKFRTMDDTRGPDGQLLADELRLSVTGRMLRKLSLDELPQLLNVLKGELSFVGPRPLLVQYLPLYNERQARRHDVKPGITGWAQVNGRNALTWDEKFDLDVWYVDHQSFLLDMKILWMTFVKVLKREGIAAAGSATMPEFKGSESYRGDK
ncbi:MAG: sugar transferase [Syntrophorhabdaceae bacterium]|nr:sugar transferase [Syntrophorhabdaceae bacterium]